MNLETFTYYAKRYARLSDELVNIQPKLKNYNSSSSSFDELYSQVTRLYDLKINISDEILDDDDLHLVTLFELISAIAEIEKVTPTCNSLVFDELIGIQTKDGLLMTFGLLDES